MFSAAGSLQTAGMSANTLLAKSQWLLTSDVLQSDCDTGSHFSRRAKGPEPQLLVSSNSCRQIIHNKIHSGVFDTMALRAKRAEEKNEIIMILMIIVI